MTSFDASLLQGPWIWVFAGIVLMGLEMVVPGAFLFWIGAAAVATGAVMAASGIGWQAGVAVFAVFGIASVLAGRWLAARGGDETTIAGGLNAPALRLVGHTCRLDEPLMRGEGRLKVGDTFWSVRGPDLAAGSLVKVVGVEGATLVVDQV
jgi:membrane protein implicated in regulation of membrane protease activity